MLHNCFKQTMDDLNIGVSALANKLGRDPSYLSHIRSGSINPPINKFWIMLEAMEELKPGAIEHFGILIAKIDQNSLYLNLVRGLKPDELASLITDEQLAGLLHVLGNRIIQKSSSGGSFPEEKLNIDSDIVVVG